MSDSDAAAAAAAEALPVKERLNFWKAAEAERLKTLEEEKKREDEKAKRAKDRTDKDKSQSIDITESKSNSDVKSVMALWKEREKQRGQNPSQDFDRVKDKHEEAELKKLAATNKEERLANTIIENDTKSPNKMSKIEIEFAAKIEQESKMKEEDDKKRKEHEMAAEIERIRAQKKDAEDGAAPSETKTSECSEAPFNADDNKVDESSSVRFADLCEEKEPSDKSSDKSKPVQFSNSILKKRAPPPLPTLASINTKPELLSPVPSSAQPNSPFTPRTPPPIPSSPAPSSSTASLPAPSSPVSQSRSSISYNATESTNGVEKSDDPAYLERQAEQRKRVRAEVVSSEQSYVNSLSTLVTDFITPLKTHSSDYGLSLTDVMMIFSNIELLYNFHCVFLVDMSKAGDNCAETFLKFADFLKMYTQYLQSYSNSLSGINAQRNNSKFQSFIASRREKCGLDLMSYLIMPVQRIPRYELLLRELVRYTPQSDPEHSKLTEAFMKIQKIAIHVNESRRTAENMSKLLEIQNSMNGECGALMQPFRRLVREGVVNKLSGGLLTSSIQTRKLYVFNDIILWTTANGKYRGQGKLEGISAQKWKDGKGKTGMELRVPGRDKELILVCSEKEAAEWIHDILTAGKLNSELGEQTRRRKEAAHSYSLSIALQSNDSALLALQQHSNSVHRRTTTIAAPQHEQSTTSSNRRSANKRNGANSMHTFVKDALRDLRANSTTSNEESSNNGNDSHENSMTDESNGSEILDTKDATEECEKQVDECVM